MTPSELSFATGARHDRAVVFQPLIDELAPKYKIDTQERMSAYLAQIGHESGGFKWLTEIWGPTPAQKRYEGRHDLGNTSIGDGYRYRGRGLIQITGRFNYKRVSESMGVDFLNLPERLSLPRYATESSMVFWNSNGLNELADHDNFKKITLVVNGGLNGYDERLALWQKAKEALA